MARTVLEIQTDIGTLTEAITSLTLGKRITTLIVGSGAFQRRYTYQEVTLENLNAQLSMYEAELLAAKSLVAGTPLLPTFRSFGSLRMGYSKGVQ